MITDFVVLVNFLLVYQNRDLQSCLYTPKVLSNLWSEQGRMTREFCCEKFKEEYESECIRHDTEIFKYSGDRKGVYYLMFEGNIASAPLVFCPYCGKRLVGS